MILSVFCISYFPLNVNIYRFLFLFVVKKKITEAIEHLYEMDKLHPDTITPARVSRKETRDWCMDHPDNLPTKTI